MTVNAPVIDDDFLDGLAIMGWSLTSNLESESSNVRPIQRPIKKGIESVAHSPGHRYSFLGKLEARIEPRNTDVIEWTALKRISAPTFEPVIGDGPRRIEDTSIKPNEEYQLHLISRLTAHSTQRAVLDGLREIGWQPSFIFPTNREYRPTSRRQVDMSSWFCVATWTRQECIMTVDDRFFFESIEQVRVNDGS